MEASSDRVSYSGLGAKETIPEPAPASCSGRALLHTAAVFARVPSRFPVISTLLDMDVYLPPPWCVPARHAADYPAPWLFLPSSCKPFGNKAAKMAWGRFAARSSAGVTGTVWINGLPNFCPKQKGLLLPGCQPPPYGFPGNWLVMLLLYTQVSIIF